MHGCGHSSHENFQGDSRGFIPLYQAALCLMGKVSYSYFFLEFSIVIVKLQLVTLASEHVHYGVCVDNSESNQLPIEQSNLKCCDVYVWGSNSSHQLAETSPEKIFIPQLANTFSNVQQVHKCF
jgi:hypothetical protein